MNNTTSERSKPTASEQATLNFYEWDYLGRGYYFFDNQVDIEPPYIPFRHEIVSDKLSIDDGKIPSLFDRVIGLFETKEHRSKEIIKSPLIDPNPASRAVLQVGFSISFPYGEEISPHISIEFINLLSYTEAPISFEIIGTYDTISVLIICSNHDKSRIESLLRAYFPIVILKEIEVRGIPFNIGESVAICDFGLNSEFVLPIDTAPSFSIDPLTSIIATLDNLQMGDTVLFQIIFKGVTAPWAKDIPYAVSDGLGGSFFSDSPEMVQCAKEKISSPLFSCVFRLAAQGGNREKSEYLATQVARSISTVSTSEFNKLIPLSNEGYNYDDHLFNVYHRTSNRIGMILNSSELVQFVHYPNKTVVSIKLSLHGIKTKEVSTEDIGQQYLLGINSHNGTELEVTTNDQVRLRHTHIIGATGVGKSTLIANMIFEDINHGNGCALFDPHGDIVEDILLRIPESRREDVIIIDPSDSDFPIGFNLLGAKTDVEKIVLSSDLVSTFKRHATAWGDNMTAVLSNAINAFLESNKNGTLIELKRFLLEENFRNDFLKTVDDQSIHYYWHYEYPMVKKGIAPLLTRIDTFLRPKIIRYMLAQTNGVDFRECIEKKKILLIKLSQGLIGEENSYLLGSLFLSKLNQVAQGRQSLDKHERHPYYVYLDEFQNFITPSITSILSGARKYGLGLILAHQELGQIDDPKTLNSVISNPYTRICFRLGDTDAKKLENGFSYFEQSDLQNLGVGEAIIRLGSSANDFNLKTFPLSEIDFNAKDITNYIIDNTRKKYAQPISEIKILEENLLPKRFTKERSVERNEKEEQPLMVVKEEVAPNNTKDTEVISEEKKSELIQYESDSIELRTHRYLQTMIKKLGQERNFIATIEKPTPDGGRIDVVLERDGVMIAFEISETNKPAYEVQNISKCLKANCDKVIVVSKNKKHLNAIERLAKEKLSKKDISLVKFIQPNDVTSLLDDLMPRPKPKEERVKGFRVITEFEEDKTENSNAIKSRIAKLLKNKKNRPK